MSQQFRRAWELNVHGRKVVGLDIEFEIARSRKSSQNTAEFVVYNLSPDTRKYLSEQKKPIVEFRAGYADVPALPLLYLGELRFVTHVQEGASWKTIVTTGDGDAAKKRPISFSLGPGTTFEAAVKRIVSDMGVKAGNIAGALLQGKFSDASKQFAQGFAAHGNGDEELRKLLAAGGLEHSYQNGVLQVLPRGADLGNTAPVIKAGTGLVGSPEIGNKGIVKFRSLLNAAIVPAGVVKIESANLTGFYVVSKATYLGQSAGGDWYTDCECKVRK